MRRVFLVVALVFLLFSRAAGAQTKPAASAVPALVAVQEEEAPDSPRASVRNFYDLAERAHYDEAAIYLDLPHGTEKRGAELASKLYAVLSQRLLIHPEALSPLPTGRAADGLPIGTEELGKINDAKGHPVSIRLVRHEASKSDDEPRWVFAGSTVSKVDVLYSALRDRWVREHLPSSLLVVGPLSLYYWQWLALPLLAAVSIAIGRVLTWLGIVVWTRLLRSRPWGTRLLDGLKGPVTFGWALIALALVVPYIALTLLAEETVYKGLTAVGILVFFWGLLRAVTIFGDELMRAKWAKQHPTARGLSSVAVSLGKILVSFFALMVALAELGYSITSLIAGLGIGGIAVALAAQKTVENLFGSLSILVDQPFRVGDTVRVDTIEGTVETIGLRSTRVRTVDRTLIIFPNGKLADMRIESLGPRDRIRFATKLQLVRTTTMQHLNDAIAGVRTKLLAHALVRADDVFVGFSGIGEASYDVDVACTLNTTDWNVYAKAREELLVACIEAVRAAGADLAVPTRQLVGAAVGKTLDPRPDLA